MSVLKCRVPRVFRIPRDVILSTELCPDKCPPNLIQVRIWWLQIFFHFTYLRRWITRCAPYSRFKRLNLDAHLSAESVLNLDAHLSAERVLNLDAHLLAERVLNLDAHLSAESALNLDAHLSAEGALNLDAHLSAESALNLDAHLSAESVLNLRGGAQLWNSRFSNFLMEPLIRYTFTGEGRTAPY